MSTISDIHSAVVRHFEYDVALSFAEEDRKFVETVAYHLKRNNIKVYYDKDERIDAWGRDIYSHLNGIYQYKARFCVMFISKYYRDKYWTQHEQISAQARQLIETKSAYILPFRFDNTKIDGLPDTRAFLSVNSFNEKKLAEAIIAKLKEAKDKPALIKPESGTKIGLSWLQKLQRILQQKMKIGLAIIITLSMLAFGLRDRLTPVSTLATRIHERSKNFDCVICKDGWLSHSHGSGTCSHHGGVNHNVDSVIYSKTLEQCKKEAEEISWLPP